MPVTVLNIFFYSEVIGMTVNSRGFPVLMVDLSWTLIHKAVQIVYVLLVYKGSSLHPSVLCCVQQSERPRTFAD